ncbi:hypothetical protein LRC484719_32890 [Mycobacterium riyadhense]
MLYKSSANLSKAAAATSIGAEPGPECIRAELTSGGKKQGSTEIVTGLPANRDQAT